MNNHGIVVPAVEHMPGADIRDAGRAEIDVCPECGAKGDDIRTTDGQYSHPGPLWVQDRQCLACGCAWSQVYAPVRIDVTLHGNRRGGAFVSDAEPRGRKGQ